MTLTENRVVARERKGWKLKTKTWMKNKTISNPGFDLCSLQSANVRLFASRTDTLEMTINWTVVSYFSLQKFARLDKKKQTGNKQARSLKRASLSWRLMISYFKVSHMPMIAVLIDLPCDRFPCAKTFKLSLSVQIIIWWCYNLLFFFLLLFFHNPCIWKVVSKFQRDGILFHFLSFNSFSTAIVCTRSFAKVFTNTQTQRVNCLRILESKLLSSRSIKSLSLQIPFCFAMRTEAIWVSWYWVAKQEIKECTNHLLVCLWSN